MLRWRFLLGTLIIAALVGLCWLDHTASVPGVWLMPVAAILVVLATSEVMQLMRAAGATPRAGIVYCGNLLILFSNWMPTLLAKGNLWQAPAGGNLSWQQAMAMASWPLAVFTIFTLALFINEKRLFEKPGRAMANMSATLFALIYAGVLFSFLVQFRLSWGISALLSLIIAVKMGDTGAYLTGRLLGRHKMSPVISPGKTVEGGIGAVCFACLGAWLSWWFLFPAINNVAFAGSVTWAWLPFGIVVGTAGIFGDLAESLIKRDVGRKDSSTWLPGFGGVLDILDSLLFAAPAGWILLIFLQWLSTLG
jgi:phosphatidate cytidylyltransferase